MRRDCIARLGAATMPDTMFDEATEDDQGNDQRDRDDGTQKLINPLTIDALPASGTQGLSPGERPALDATPWDGIKDYDASDDLGDLVARNMATWETQLRERDGQLLTDDELTLTDAVTKLQKSRNIEILLHSGWTQAVPSRDTGKPITIEAGDTYVERRSGAQLTRLNGEITVTLGRYLHVHPTLFYTPVSAEDDNGTGDTGPNPLTQADRSDAPAGGSPAVRDLSSPANQRSRSALDRLRDRDAVEGFADNINSPGLRSDSARESMRKTDFEAQPPSYIRLDQSRRVRSSELHYIDHPELGMLVRVTPVVASELLQEQFALLE